MSDGPITYSIRQKLTEALHPARLELIDESVRHKGHGGSHPEGESHFRLLIVADAFREQSRLARHRLIHQILAEELKTRVHALAILALSPEEQE